MSGQQSVDGGGVLRLDCAAELRVCGEYCACSAQPGMAPSRQLAGDGCSLVQDLVAAVRDIPVGGQQYRCNATELGEDDKQSRKRQNF